MTFLLDPQELKTGLIIFRRGDVKHRNWCCRITLPQADRYRTVCLKTSDVDAAKERAFDEDTDLRFRIKHDVPIFNRRFSGVAKACQPASKFAPRSACNIAHPLARVVQSRGGVARSPCIAQRAAGGRTRTVG